MSDWLKGFFFSIIQVVIGLILGAIIPLLYKTIKRAVSLSKLRRIFNFKERKAGANRSRWHKIVIAYPPFPQRGSVLRRLAIEDFMAIDAVKTFLVENGFGRHRDIEIADGDRVVRSAAHRNENVITICSPKRNQFTKGIQKRLRDGYLLKEKDKTSGEWKIAVKDNGVILGGGFESEAYETIRNFIKEGNLVEEQRIEDVALIAKIPNSYYQGPGTPPKVIIVAGVRAIGTWGAAEFLVRKWKDLADIHPDIKKGKDFFAVIRVVYENYQILLDECHILAHRVC